MNLTGLEILEINRNYPTGSYKTPYFDTPFHSQEKSKNNFWGQIDGAQSMSFLLIYRFSLQKNIFTPKNGDLFEKTCYDKFSEKSDALSISKKGPSC